MLTFKKVRDELLSTQSQLKRRKNQPIFSLPPLDFSQNLDTSKESLLKKPTFLSTKGKIIFSLSNYLKQFFIADEMNNPTLSLATENKVASLLLNEFFISEFKFDFSNSSRNFS